MIPPETSLEKSKKRRAIALAALGGCGGLGQLWEALAELWEALGELWEGLEELWKSSGGALGGSGGALEELWELSI